MQLKFNRKQACGNINYNQQVWRQILQRNLLVQFNKYQISNYKKFIISYWSESR